MTIDYVRRGRINGNMSMEHLSNDNDRGNPKYVEENASRTGVTLFTTNPTQTALRSKPGLRGEKPAINRMIHSTA